MMTALLVLIGTIASTVAGIATASQQLISLWGELKGLLPVVDPEKYFDKASVEGERLSSMLRDSRAHLDATKPYAESLLKQALWHTATVSALLAVFASALLFSLLVLFGTGSRLTETAVILIGLAVGFGTSYGVWLLSQPGRLRRFIENARERARSARLEGPLEALETFAAEASKVFRDTRLSRIGRLPWLRSLSVLEFDFLAAYVELQCQIRSLEMWRYVKGLGQLRSEIYETSRRDILNIFEHVISDLVSRNELKEKPRADAGVEEWRAHQRGVIETEFKMLGFRSSLDVAEGLIECDFVDTVKKGQLIAVLKTYMGDPDLDKKGWLTRR